MLPSGTRLQITSKVPIANLFYMMSIAFDLDSPISRRPRRLEEFEDVLAAIAESFADAIERRLEVGLDRSYVDEDNNLSFMRGRINFTEDLRRNLLRQHVYCRYSEFTCPIEENQIVRQVVHLLSGWGFHKQLCLRLSQLDTALAEMRPTVSPSSTIDRFRYNRFDEDYRYIHRRCRLFREGSSLSENLGAWDSRTFLLAACSKLVTQLLQTRTGGHSG